MAESVTEKVRIVTTNPHDVAVDIQIERSLAGAGSWTTVTTITGHPPGQVVTVDNDVNCGVDYDYRARCSLSGFTTSAYSATASIEACEPSPV